MKKLILILIFTTTVFAADNQFKIAGKYYSFIEKDTFLVSQNCKEKCIALTKMNSLKSKITPKKKKFASSIGSYACTEVLNGQSVLGIKKNKDMVAVCLFKKDSSMIDINSITNHNNAL